MLELSFYNLHAIIATAYYIYARRTSAHVDCSRTLYMLIQHQSTVHVVYGSLYRLGRLYAHGTIGAIVIGFNGSYRSLFDR